jgi:hypothetical protein
MNTVEDWGEDQIDHEKKTPAPFSLILEKVDGFHVVVDKTDGKNIQLLTKAGNLYNAKQFTRLQQVYNIIMQNFSTVLHQNADHPNAGKAIKIYAEITCDTDGNGDNLQALMHGDLAELRKNATWRLRIFDCEFAHKTVQVSLEDKLNLFREKLGPQYVVQTLLSAHEPLRQWRLNALDKHMATAEGIVAILPNGKKIKHKVSLPVPLWLVAVGFNNFGIAKVPTHFAWAVRTELHSIEGEKGEHFTVVLIDDKGHLCNIEERVSQGKMYINPMHFSCSENGQITNVVIRCTDPSFAGRNYDTLLSMAGKLVDATEQTKLVITRGMRVYTVHENRKIKFDAAEFKLLKKPVIGVIGANRISVGKNGGAESIHLQAPQFLACPASETVKEAYGHPVHQMLIPGYTNHETAFLPTPPTLTLNLLLRLASIPRDADEHARIVYGFEESGDGFGESGDGFDESRDIIRRNIDLVHGRLLEEMQSPQLTPQRLDDEEEEEAVQPDESSDEDESGPKKMARLSEHDR